MPNSLTAEQIREQTLTLLLIERERINERLAELDFKERKSPAVKRGKRSKRPSVFVLFGTTPPTGSLQT
jgi:hypothetical protein